MIKANRDPGVSFILRCRNEEQYLQGALESLKPLTIPYEIVVILHRCTDKSKEIAEAAKAAGQPIRIFENEQLLSRAGYETLVTPVNHVANLAFFYNWCFSKANYNWIFKWDADFTATPELIEFLNGDLPIAERRPFRYLIPCRMTDDIINKEEYLFNCLEKYTKYIFWEVPGFSQNSRQEKITAMIQTIPPTVLKSYWREPPWFLGVDADLEQKYRKLVELCGPEPMGAARASCKLCDAVWYKVHEKRKEIEALGIKLVESQ